MKCPHCHKAIHPELKTVELGREGREPGNWQYFWLVHRLTCPACFKPVIFVEYQQDYGTSRFEIPS